MRPPGLGYVAPSYGVTSAQLNELDAEIGKRAGIPPKWVGFVAGGVLLWMMLDKVPKRSRRRR